MKSGVRDLTKITALTTQQEDLMNALMQNCELRSQLIDLQLGRKSSRVNGLLTQMTEFVNTRSLTVKRRMQKKALENLRSQMGIQNHRDSDEEASVQSELDTADCKNIMLVKQLNKRGQLLLTKQNHMDVIKRFFVPLENQKLERRSDMDVKADKQASKQAIPDVK